MKAKRTVLTALLSLGLLTAPGPRELEIPLVGVEEAYAAKCTEEVCVSINLKIIEISMCRSRTYTC